MTIRRLLAATFLTLTLSASLAAQTSTRVVAYIPVYKHMDGLVDVVKAMNWQGVTDVDLAFLNPPPCANVCDEHSDMSFSSAQHTDAEIDAIVAFAHAKGMRVVASIGGGSTTPIPAIYNAGLSAPLVASLRSYVRQHRLDGVDVDIETPDSMGAPYARFVHQLVVAMHADHKLVTAAVARYMQLAMPDATLHEFDWINVMAYGNYSSAVAMLEYYANARSMPRERIVLGVPLYGQGATGQKADYAAILSAYPNAWRMDAVSGGTLNDGAAFNYVGEETMAREVQLGRKYGGVMMWQVFADAPPPHSLMDVVRRGVPQAY